jgi:hypothetical protein
VQRLERAPEFVSGASDTRSDRWQGPADRAEIANGATNGSCAVPLSTFSVPPSRVIDENVAFVAATEARMAWFP